MPQSTGLRRLLRPQVFATWSGWLARDWTPERIEQVLRSALSGDHINQWELFALMEDTWPRLQKALAELRRAVVQMDWRCEPWAEDGKPPTTAAEERARLVSRAVWSMRPQPDEPANGFEGLLFDLLDAWGKGVSVQEIEWQVRRVGTSGTTEVIPLASQWVAPSQYAWTETGRLMLRLADTHPVASGMPRTDVLMPFPPDQFLIGICKSRTGPVMGGALLRPLAWWWCAANFSASWLLNLAQIFGLPIRWASYAPGASDELISKICDMLENMGSAAWAAFPAGTQVELKEASKNGGTSPQDSLLDRADRQVDLLVLGQTLTTDVGNSGSRALGNVHKSVRDEIVQAAADWAASVVNLQLVPAILRLNYGDDQEAPEFCPRPTEALDLKANADRDAVLLDRGVALPRDWFYARHKIPLPGPGDEVIMKPAGSGGPLPVHDPDGMGGDDAGMTASGRQHALLARRSEEQLRLADHVLEQVTSVQAEWLGGARPWFKRLVVAAQDPAVTDAEFLGLIERARDNVPGEIGPLLNTSAVARALESAMGASMVNGAMQGHLSRTVRLAKLPA